jgi:hypothetical protein
MVVEVTGTDLDGRPFTELSHTEQVGLHGGSVVLSRPTLPSQPVTVRRPVLDSKVVARVLRQLGMRTGSQVYGISFTADAPDFWGVFFPPLSRPGDVLARTLLQCLQCGKKAVVVLNEMEFRGFVVSQLISRDCEACGRAAPWIPVSHEVEPAVAGLNATSPQSLNSKGPNPGDRKRPSTKMKVMASVQGPGGGEDVVQALNLSRAGMTFRGTCTYEVNSWINLAVPYTPGAANIFVTGRIASRIDLPDGRFEYAVQYVKG